MRREMTLEQHTTAALYVMVPGWFWYFIQRYLIQHGVDILIAWALAAAVVICWLRIIITPGLRAAVLAAVYPEHR